MSIAVLPDSEASAGVRFAFAHLIAQREDALLTTRYLRRTGSSWSWRVGRDVVGVTVTVPAPFFGRIVDHTAYALRSRDYTDEDVTDARALALVTRTREGAFADEVAGVSFPGRGFAEDAERAARSTQLVDSAALRAFHLRNVVGSRLAISVVGAVDVAKTRAMLERAFAGLPAGEPPTPSLVPALQGGETVILNAPGAAEARVAVVMRLPSVAPADHAAARVCAAAWSDLSWARLRVRRWMSYSTGARLVWLPEAAAIVAEASVAPEEVGAALEEMEGGLRRAAEVATSQREEAWRSIAVRAHDVEATADDLSRRIALHTPLVDTEPPSAEDVSRVCAALSTAPTGSVVLGDGKILLSDLARRGRRVRLRPLP